MNVGDLRKRLEGVDENLLVVTPGGDHEYFEIRCVGLDRAESVDGYLGEHYEGYELDDDTKVIDVFVVDAS